LYRTGQAYRHFTLPVLNGAIGDQLAERQDRRAIQMSFRQHGTDVAVPDLRLTNERQKTVVFLHGLMGDEMIWQSGVADTPRYGPLLQAEAGVRSLYVRYNSGLHISQNGQLLNTLLTELLETHAEAIGELVLVGHSMGGLVIRSAGYYGTRKGQEPAPWVERLRSVFLLGVPNDGSFLEQNSHFTSTLLRKINVAPTRFLSKAMDQRSNGIKDLRYAWLIDEDWQNPRANDIFAPRTVVPPLPGVHYHVLVGSLLKTLGSALDHYFGDGLVGGGSAIGRTFGDPALPAGSVVTTTVFSQQSHIGLLSNPQVYEYLRAHV
jgi:pimeloyl-ACP methyl ester carboxylesterase